MLTNDKITEIFCITDKFCKKFNFIMNLIAALGAYSLFDKKPSIKVEWQHSTDHLELFY
jgi:hypothetical protein